MKSFKNFKKPSKAHKLRSKKLVRKNKKVSLRGGVRLERPQLSANTRPKAPQYVAPTGKVNTTLHNSKLNQLRKELNKIKVNNSVKPVKSGRRRSPSPPLPPLPSRPLPSPPLPARPSRPLPSPPLPPLPARPLQVSTLPEYVDLGNVQPVVQKSKLYMPMGPGGSPPVSSRI